MRLFESAQDFNPLRRELERVFESLGVPSPLARNAFLPARGPRQYPVLNLSEDADQFTVEALAPGLDPESLQITILRNQVTIAGEKTGPKNAVRSEDIHRSERATGRFVRTFTLPTEVDDKKVSAEYKAGILTLTLPKAEATKPRRVAVTVS